MLGLQQSCPSFRRRQIHASGHWVKGLREATARKAALDAVAASWTIGTRRTGAVQHRHMLSEPG